MLVTSPYSLSLWVGKANARFPRLEAFQWDFDANVRWKGGAVEDWKRQTLHRWKSALMLQQLLYWIFSGACFQSTKSWSLELILITKAVYSPHRYKPPLWSTFEVGCDSTQNLLNKLAFFNYPPHLHSLIGLQAQESFEAHAKLNHYALILI